MPEAEAKKWVFDSWALLAFLEDEPSAGKVEDLIARASESQGPSMPRSDRRPEIQTTGARGPVILGVLDGGSSYHLMN